MQQLHVVMRGSKFYFRIAVPIALVAIVGKHEVKASLRTSDAISAKLRGRVLSNGLELLFHELRTMLPISNVQILERAKTYFALQLSKSLELAFLLPTDPQCDLDDEIAGTEVFAEQLRASLKTQTFSLSVQSDAEALLGTNPSITQSKASEAFKFACNAILRAKIENARILSAKLRGNYHETSPQDPWFSGITAMALPALPGEEVVSKYAGPTLSTTADQYYEFKSSKEWAAKTAGDQKRVIELVVELLGSDVSAMP